MSEAATMHEIMVELSKRGCKVFRANVGLFFTKDGRPVRSGLPIGFSDLFGFRPDGRIFFVEVKAERGRLRSEQTRFITAMQEAGAIACVARSVPEALAGVMAE